MQLYIINCEYDTYIYATHINNSIIVFELDEDERNDMILNY